MGLNLSTNQLIVEKSTLEPCRTCILVPNPAQHIQPLLQTYLQP